jgi:hypothetical protein
MWYISTKEVVGVGIYSRNKELEIVGHFNTLSFQSSLPSTMTSQHARYKPYIPHKVQLKALKVPG